MKIQADRLQGHLREPLLPCYLVSGDEPLLVQEAIDGIRAAAREQGFDSRDLYVQMQGFDWNQLAATANEMSLFSSRRIIELRLPTGKPGREGGATIVELAEKCGDDLLLLVQTPKLDRTTSGSKWAKALDARGATVPIWPIGTRELPAWLNGRMRSLDLEPDRDAVRMIADRVEGNLLAAQQEIEKLRLLHGEGPVTADDVGRAVADSSRFDVYQLADAALAGNTARALRILDGVRAEGVDAVVVLWALTRELRTLARLAGAIADGQNLGAAMQKTGVWRNRQNLVRACVGRHSRDDFYRLLKLGRIADAAAKGQMPGDAWQLATNIVWRLAGGREVAA